jgi:hypothetical protein
MKIIGYFIKDGKPVAIEAVEGKDNATVFKEIATKEGVDIGLFKEGAPPSETPAPNTPAALPAPPNPGPPQSALPQLAPEPQTPAAPKPGAPPGPNKPATPVVQPRWSSAAQTLLDGCKAPPCPSPK